MDEYKKFGTPTFMCDSLVPYYEKHLNALSESNLSMEEIAIELAGRDRDIDSHLSFQKERQSGFQMTFKRVSDSLPTDGQTVIFVVNLPSRVHKFITTGTYHDKHGWWETEDHTAIYKTNGITHWCSYEDCLISASIDDGRKAAEEGRVTTIPESVDIMQFLEEEKFKKIVDM